MGVVRALKIVKETLADYPDTPIHLLGMIVHNTQLNEALVKSGVIIHQDALKSRSELLDEIQSGVVIFSAHGVSQEIYDRAIAKGLTVVDASCPDVILTHNVISEYLKQDCRVLYLGKKNHPEAEAALSLDPKRILLIASEDDAKALAYSEEKTVAITQTTMSQEDVKDWLEILYQKRPQLFLCKEICAATRQRQDALLDIQDDLLVVVGDPLSNNSRNLARIARRRHPKLTVLFVSSVKELKNQDLSPYHSASVTSGASTPGILSRQVIEYLEAWPKKTVFPPLTADDLL